MARMAPHKEIGVGDEQVLDGSRSEAAPVALAAPIDALPWFVLPLAGPFGLIVAATMTWLNLQSM